MLDYTCEDGVWNYIHHNNFEVTVTNPDGSRELIEQKLVTASMKTLGVYASPIHGGRELADSYFSRRDFAFSLSKSRLSSLYLETPSLNQFNFANFSHRFACINSFVCRDQ